MSHHLRVSLLPTETTDMPHAHMSGRDHTIPCLTFADNMYAPVEVVIQLGNHPNPVAYLNALSAAALRLADEYEAARTVSA